MHGNGRPMNDTRIAFFDTKPYDRESFDRINRDHGFTIKYFPNHLNIDTAPLVAGYDTACVFVNDTIDAAVIDMLYDSGLRLLALRCAGYNNVDFESAYGRIHVVRVPAYSPYAVAEHTVALILALNRKTHRAYYRTREGNFNISGLLGFDMHGKTAGVIGTGRIGRVLIGILRGFGIRVLAYDIHSSEDVAHELGFEYTGLDRLYAESDIITLNCPLTNETHHMINAGSIARMKDNVMIINTGRGQLIDTPALVEGLKSRKVGAAGLDVYEEESAYFFEDFSNTVISDDVLARLMTFPNVLITSHQGFFTREALDNIASVTLNNIRAYFAGEALENEICYQCHEDCLKETTGRCF